MKTNLIRFICIFIAATLFSFFLLSTPRTEESIKNIEKTTVKVPLFIISKSQETVVATTETDEYKTTETAEQIPSELPENEQTQTESYINNYLDTDSVSEELTLPVIDFKTVYSKIVYPAALRRKNIEASFKVRVFADTHGNISLSFPEGTESAFVKSIEKAFRGIKATPAMYKGKPADVTFTIPVVFQLR